MDRAVASELLRECCAWIVEQSGMDDADEIHVALGPSTTFQLAMISRMTLSGCILIAASQARLPLATFLAFDTLRNSTLVKTLNLSHCSITLLQ